jgi:tetratricopeptide (TPR) repeat protein
MTAFRTGVFLAILLSAAKIAFAQNVPGYPNIEDLDPREVSLLPRYCIYTQIFNTKVLAGKNPEEIKRWSNLLGPGFLSLHHYCWGLMRTNRALFLTKDKQTREFYLDTSIDEFNYVIRNSPPDFVLLPEILTKKGENLIRRGKGPLGAVELQRAIELKPDYWPPYLALSDYFRDIGNLRQAKQMAQQGLEKAPDATILKRRIESLEAAGKKGR